MYTIELTEADVATLEWVGDRYGWSAEFPVREVGRHLLGEAEMWEWKEAVEADMLGGHPAFPCLDLDSDLFLKLLTLWEAIV